jgi:hypothetical protein
MSLSYWIMRPGAPIGGFSVESDYIPVWPDLSKLGKESLLLCAVDETETREGREKDGIARDVVPLAGPDDPLIAQVERIIKLRDTKSLDDLKVQCRQILESRAGSSAMQAAAHTVLRRITPEDPQTAFHLILLRLQAPDKIPGYELDRELKFLNKYLDKPSKPVHEWQELTDRLIPLLTARRDPINGTAEVNFGPAVLHLLARVVQPTNDPKPVVRPLRAAALNGVLKAIREAKPAVLTGEDLIDKKTPQIEADAKAVEVWLQTMPH